MNESLKYYGAFIGLGVGSFIIDGIVFSLWKLLSETIAQRFRAKYLESYIKRNVKWLEQKNLYELSSRFKLNCLMIERATGDKVALFFNINGIVVAGVIAGICVRWTFSLFLFAILPVGIVVVGYFIYVLIIRKIETKEFYSKAESQSTEAVTLIKTVKMLGAEKYQEGIYNECLKEYEKKMSPYPLKSAISIALFYFIQYLLLGIGFMYGIQCVKGTSACPVSITGSRYTIGELHIVFFEIFMCAYFFLQLASNFDAIRDAINCSKEIFAFMRDTEA
jgi:ABC-type multidrug transport system fused ATPase/permease subunit